MAIKQDCPLNAQQSPNCNIGILKYFLNILHINAQSLLGNFDIELLVRENNLDVMYVCETWLLPNMQSNFVDIPRYSLYRFDGRRGGGVGIYVSNHLKVTTLKTPELERPPNLEDIWLTIENEKFLSFILGCVYRHPRALSDTFDYISEIFRSVCFKKQTSHYCR